MKKRYLLTKKEGVFFSLFALPLLLVFLFPLFYYQQKNRLTLLEEHFDRVYQTTCHQVKKQAVNHLLRDHYSTIDTDFMTKRIETVELLKKEKEALTKQTHLQLPGSERLKERLRFIQEENRLRFVDKGGEKKEGVQEKLFALSHPVEIDGSDLRELLKRLEASEERSPLLLISSLKLKKKELPASNEVFECSLEVIKREFYAP